MPDATPEGAAGHEVVIAPMTAAHLEEVLVIERAAYPTPWSRELFESELSKLSTRAYYVASVDGRVRGYGGVLMAGDEAHVATVAVEPAWQGRGLAKRLLLHLTAAALDRGATAATLEVRADNRAAQRLYARFGYMPVGVRKGYYVVQGRQIDAVIMTADDIRDPRYRVRLSAIAAGLEGGTRVEPDLPPA